MATSDELASKAKEHRRLGRLEEAMISARHAATLDPQNADAVWQLALCELDLHGPARATKSLERVTELAPRFAYGWTQLGLALRKTGQSERAKACLERAVQLDDEDLVALRELAPIYEQEKRADDELRVLLALENLDDLNIYQTNRIGILYHNKKELYTAIRYYRRVAEDGSGPSGFFNLGLVFNEPEIGQRADAVDAWRRALDEDPDYDRASMMIARTLPQVSELRQRVMKLGGSILSREQWYGHYVNPLELLGLDEGVELDDLDAKALQRAKKALLHEIELEDGHVEWMPGLRIDRSRAISISDELSSEAKLEYHHTVFQNKALSAFLQRGDLQHFLVDESESPLSTIIMLEDDPDGFAAWLSPLFAAQFDLALTKAVERRDTSAVRSLLDGRRWVRPEDEDKCFDGTHRQIDRLLAPLRRAADTSEQTKPTLSGVQSVLAEGHMAEILSLLPMAFHREKLEAATLVRSISIDAYNHHGDADLAKAILQLSLTFASNSPSLQGRIKEDLATLEGRIEAERKDEAHLRVGGLDCSISREGVRLGPKFISTADARALRWGMVATDDGRTRSIAFKMVIKGLSGTEIKIEWTASKDLEAQREFFGKLINAALAYLMPRIFEIIREELDNHRRVYIGNVVLTKAGVEFTVQGWFSSKTVFCPWARLTSKIENGELVVCDPENRKATVSLPLHEVDNTFVLHLLAQGS
jgi:tetratricopeptide (TPR) repeat protein